MLLEHRERGRWHIPLDEATVELYATVVLGADVEHNELCFITSNVRDFSASDDHRRPHPDIAELFTDDGGSSYFKGVEGIALALLPAEVQALVAGKDIPSPRRAISGLDDARVAMLLAVLERRAGVRLHGRGVRGDGRRHADHRTRRGPRPGDGDHLRAAGRRAAPGPGGAERDRPGGRDPRRGRRRAPARRGGAAGLRPGAGAAGQRGAAPTCGCRRSATWRWCSTT